MDDNHHNGSFRPGISLYGRPVDNTTQQQPFPSVGGFAQTQVMTSDGYRAMTKEEREEAMKAALEAGFSYDGYQVVRREFFSHKFDPTLTIKGNSIIFNNSCISRLEAVRRSLTMKLLMPSKRLQMVVARLILIVK